MDNDLMARRLRPPSEPAQTAPSPGPFVLPEYVEKQDASSFHAWPPAPPSVETTTQPPAAEPAEVWAPLAHDYATADQLDVAHEGVAPENALVLDAVSAEADAVAEAPHANDPPPWSSQARDEVPWDRPIDYEQPTDTATPDQPSWDRPAPELWADSDLSDGPAADVFGSVADADEGLPFWPDSTAGQRAAVASTPRMEEAPAMAAAASDPDDAHAPVLGDIAMPATRAWPEMNGHDAGRNDATLFAAAIAQTVEPAQAPVDVRGGWDDSLASFPSWSEPQHSPEGQTPEPAPSEWVMAAIEPTEFVDPTPESSPEQAPAAYADPNSDPEAPDPAASAAPDAAPDAELAPTVAPDQMVLAPSQPLILRIELAIVDDSRLVVGAADAAWRVNDVNAVVLEVGQSDLPAEAEAATPRHPAFEPRGNNGDAHADQESTWLEPTPPGPSADHAFPAATLDPPPWLDPAALAGPEPAPWDGPADPVPLASPDSFGFVSVPPATTQPPPWAQSPLPPQNTHLPPDDFAPSGRQAEMNPYSGVPAAPQASAPHAWASGAPQFAPLGHFSRADTTAPRLDAAQSVFAPPVYVERELAQPTPLVTATSAQAAVAQEQSDLWFLSTERADGDAASPDETNVAKEPSSILTAGVTILFAILVIVLVLVFIQLMTSLLR